MKNFKLFYIFFGICIIAFSACTVQKRSYQKGYYIDWAFKQKHAKDNTEPKIIHTSTEEKTEIVIIPKQEIASNNISANTNDANLFLAEKRVSIAPGDSCGDIILLKNADQIRAKVIEINDEVVKYKRCDNIDGPIYNMGREKIDNITYVNGYKETIEPPVRKYQPQGPPQEKEYPTDLVLACVLPFVLNIIGVIISIVLANKSKRKIEKNPTRYKGMALAKFILFFDFSLIALVAIIIIGIVTLEIAALPFLGIAFLAWLISLTVVGVYYANHN